MDSTGAIFIIGLFLIALNFVVELIAIELKEGMMKQRVRSNQPPKKPTSNGGITDGELYWADQEVTDIF